ncbi:Coiled-coil domain-containing protein 22 [Dillenia turbinata]|uniref:Coiled-coil domain-containing protein 22 n=1 Tax=Dillenia turbinata TaxID=194707 RepID=A0AAN8ZUB2_9MAGN
MEESDQILLKSLQHSGLAIPDEVSSIKDLTPTTLFFICSQSLRILNFPSVFPASLPDSMADRFKICSEIASAIQTLGYVGDISFHKFLYPSEEDLYKLVRFMVEKLSEFADAGKVPDANYIDSTSQMNGEKDESTSKAWINNEVLDIDTGKFGDRLNDLRPKTEAPVLHTSAGVSLICGSHEAQVIPQKMDTESVAERLRQGLHISDEKELINGQNATESAEQSISATGNAEALIELDEKQKHLQEQSYKLQNDITKLHDLEKHLEAEVTVKTSEVQQIEIEHKLLKAAAEMALDNQHTIDFYIQQLNEQLDARKQKVANLESEWKDLIMPLDEKRRSLQESVRETKPEVWEKLQKPKEAETEAHQITSEIKKREGEILKLSEDLKKQPKVAPRKYYIDRIKEITKNSRKQDGDIERILKETRELQLESNSIQERLHRSYAVVDEMVLREAKNDPVRQQACRLLTSIHESFEQISEKNLATDRTRREVAEYETKLVTMASRSLKIDKLQADLDAIKKENDYLEKRL